VVAGLQHADGAVPVAPEDRADVREVGHTAPLPALVRSGRIVAGPRGTTAGKSWGGPRGATDTLPVESSPGPGGPGRPEGAASHVRAVHRGPEPEGRDGQDLDRLPYLARPGQAGAPGPPRRPRPAEQPLRGIPGGTGRGVAARADRRGPLLG